MWSRKLAFLFLAAAVLWTGGCASGKIFGDRADKQTALDIDAEYPGLVNQKVAVIVDAEPSLLFENPLARYEVTEAIARKLAANVPEIQVVDARQVVDFQSRNIYWHTSPLSQVASSLGVTRLVVIELTAYRMHEPGNVNIWRGYIAGNVSVVEADGARPNDRAYDSRVAVSYPPDKPLGALNVEERTFRMATLDLFAHAAAGKFYESK